MFICGTAVALLMLRVDVVGDQVQAANVAAKRILAKAK